MNKVILMGNLGHDPSLKMVNPDMPVTKFSLATTKRKKGEKITSWHRCVAFGKTAEIIYKYFSKGSQILVEGRIQYGQYENKEGQKVPTTDIIVDRFEFVGPKKEAEGYAKPVPTPEKPESFESKAKNVEDDDIPF